MKHTPGPWMIKGESFVASTVIMTENIYEDECRHIIAKTGVESSSIRFKHEERAANARLISAAPELLESVKGMLESFELCLSEFESEGHQIVADRIRGYFHGERHKAVTALKKVTE